MRVPEYRLLPGALAVRTPIQQRLRGSPKHDHVSYELDLLPYYLSGSTQALLTLAADQLAFAQKYRARDASTRWILGPDETDVLAYSVDAFLNNARWTQNAMIPYLSHGLHGSLPSGLSLPKSMKDLIPLVRKNASLLGEPISELLLKYWERSGRQLKDYRDLQHFAKRTSEAQIFFPGEHASINLLLPSNPEVKSSSKLRFGKPEVHALQYLLGATEELIRVSAKLMHLLTPPAHSDTRVVEVMFAPRVPLTLGDGSTIAGVRIKDPEVFRAAIAHLAQHLFENEEGN